MLTKTFYLSNEKTSYVKAYLLDEIQNIEFCKKRPAIIILPGGGYEYCSDREAEPIATQYLAQGYNAFVVNYTCNKPYPASLLDAAYSLYKIRARAEEFSIDPQKIAILGCSAGGHLAGCLATMWNDTAILKALHCSADELRPNAAVLCYPVISGVTAPHKGSFEVLLGKDPSRAELSRMSLENRVTPKTPPIFLWHTANDGCVPSHNALVMAKACVSNNVPVELHMYDSGPHGLSECSKSSGWNEYFYDPHCRTWIDFSVRFLNKYMEV